MERTSRVLILVLSILLALSGGINLWQFRALRAERARIAAATASLVDAGISYLVEAERLIEDGATTGNPSSLLMAAERMEAVERTLTRIRRPLLSNSEAIAQAEQDLHGLSRQLWDARDALLKNGALTAEQRDQLLEVQRAVERLRGVVDSVQVVKAYQEAVRAGDSAARLEPDSPRPTDRDESAAAC